MTKTKGKSCLVSKPTEGKKDLQKTLSIQQKVGNEKKKLEGKGDKKKFVLIS